MSDESTAGDPTIHDTRRATERYLHAGLAVIPIPAGEKNPNRRDWQTERWTVEDIPHCWSNGQNIGVLTGEPSGWLVDIDLDCPQAVQIAGRFLDPTLTGGRESTPDAHWWYRAEGIRSMTFEDLERETVLEIRANGRQTVVAPSLHPSGERYMWSASGLEFACVEAETLLRACRELATAALVARVLPSGGRHRFGLALAGFLLRRNLEPETVAKVMHAAWDAAGYTSEKAKREAYNDIEAIVEGTDERLQEGTEEVSGGRVLGDLVEGLPRKIVRFWGWSGHDPEAEPTPRPGSAPISVKGRRPLTELGDAERFIDDHGSKVRYCRPWKQWLVWYGKRWAPDETGEVERMMKETVRGIYSEAAKEEDNSRRRALGKHARSSEAKTHMDHAIALACSEKDVPVLPDELDRDPWLLNCKNGTIDLRTGEMRDQRREDLISKIAPVEYDPSAEAPRFKQFLEEIFDSDEDLIAFVQRLAGYSLTGFSEERVVSILHGRGKNGKTTLVELLQDVMGDYARATDVETILTQRYKGGANNEVAALKGARLVSTSEVEQGRQLSEAKVKALSGNETITARFLYREDFNFKPEFTLWLSTNNKPVIKGTDDAIWDRIRLIPFEQRFDGKKADRHLGRKLREELPGVLAWMVAGCVQWHEKGLGMPEKVKAATKVYREEMDVLQAFFDDCCVLHEEATAPATPLYKDYQQWCADSGEPEESQRAFGGRLRDRGFESFKYTGGPHADRMGWRGIGLRHEGGGDDGDGGGGGSEGGGDEPPSSSATSEDQGRPSADKREQDTHNAANDAEVPPMSGGSSEVPPIDESALDKAESHEEAGGIGGIGGNIPTTSP